MLICKIVSDSSSDIKSIESIPYGVAPLKIITDEKEYCDDERLNVHSMLDDLQSYKGRSRSACPNVEDWKREFEGYECVFCITITSGLSGSYNSAQVAVKEFLQEGENRRAYVIDSLSTGPENTLLIEKLQELILAGKNFDKICKEIEEYKSTTHLIFALESMHNLANNGRISPIVAKVAGVLGIRLIGKASLQGTLEMTNKSKGAKKAVSDILKNLQSNGYNGGKIRIHHCENEDLAKKLSSQITEMFPSADPIICPTTALCSFYAERGGLIIGYEGNKKY